MTGNDLVNLLCRQLGESTGRRFPCFCDPMKAILTFTDDEEDMAFRLLKVVAAHTGEIVGEDDRG